MQTLTINTVNDFYRSSFDVDLFYQEQELWVISKNKKYIIKPKNIIQSEIYNEKGKLLKRIPKAIPLYSCSLREYYANLFVKLLNKEGVEAINFVLEYRQTNKHYNKNYFEACIVFDWSLESDYIPYLSEEVITIYANTIKQVFPKACIINMYEEKYGSHIITFSIPEFE